MTKVTTKKKLAVLGNGFLADALALGGDEGRDKLR